MKMRVGILTSGGDCPGLNATIRGVAKALYQRMGDKVEIIGILNGYDGLINGNYRVMAPDEFSGILTVGGTILGTKRTPFKMMRANFATKFGPSEYFALMVLGLTSIAGMTGKSPAKGFLAAFIGLFVAGIGIDLIFGTTKFVFGNVNLYSGIDFVRLLQLRPPLHGRIKLLL